MPNYHFHILDTMDVSDEEGEELADLAAARSKAIDYVRDLAAVAVRQGRINRRHRIDIEDGNGNVLATVTVADAVEIES